MDLITSIFDAITAILATLLNSGTDAYAGVAGALSSVIDASSTVDAAPVAGAAE